MSDFGVPANLVDEIWYWGLVLTGVSLVMNKVNHVFICLDSDSLLGPWPSAGTDEVLRREF